MENILPKQTEDMIICQVNSLELESQLLITHLLYHQKCKKVKVIIFPFLAMPPSDLL